jgi:hypothetical protein
MVQSTHHISVVTCTLGLQTFLLQRFKQYNGTASKIETKVSFPLKLEMFPYTNRARIQDEKQRLELAKFCTYELQTVVVHVGKIETGKFYPSTPAPILT